MTDVLRVSRKELTSTEVLAELKRGNRVIVESTCSASSMQSLPDDQFAPVIVRSTDWAETLNRSR